MTETTQHSKNDLPAQDTELVVTPEVEIDVDFDGDAVEMIAAACDQRSTLQLQTGAGVEILTVQLAANESYGWATNHDYVGATNPMAGEVIGKAMASCGTATAATMKFGVLYDSV